MLNVQSEFNHLYYLALPPSPGRRPALAAAPQAYGSLASARGERMGIALLLVKG